VSRRGREASNASSRSPNARAIGVWNMSPNRGVTNVAMTASTFA
jgi:hypothetical protein